MLLLLVVRIVEPEYAALGILRNPFSQSVHLAMDEWSLTEAAALSSMESCSRSESIAYM